MVTVKDNRTGNEYDFPIERGTVRALDWRRIRSSRDDNVGLMSYDPGLGNTAICESGITLMNAAKGLLYYRGYPIDQLVERCSYLEVAYLLINGDLPDGSGLKAWTEGVKNNAVLHPNTRRIIYGFDTRSNPIAILVSTVASLSALYSKRSRYLEPQVRKVHMRRLIAKISTIVSSVSRHCRGLAPLHPNKNLSYSGNIINMIQEKKDRLNPLFERALDALFILHADHEQNCSTTVMRCVGSALADSYLCAAAAAAALTGPLHGGASVEVLRMLRTIGSKKRVPEYLIRAKTGEVKLSGFGHQVYEAYDPRARIIKQLAVEIAEVKRTDVLLDIALEIERITLGDEFFVSRSFYPTIELYSGILYRSMGFPADALPLLFVIPRTSGWLAHWNEMLSDPRQGMVRPRQIYNGHMDRGVTPLRHEPPPA
jgi:citrate synthase